MLRIELAETRAAIRACHPVMVQLRGQFDVDAFEAQVQRQRLLGYRLAFGVDDAGTVQVVAGFVVTEKLAWGRHLYVDDLVTDAAHRSSGAGAAMLDWLRSFAVEAGCAELHLDSGVQRFDAHRFYDREGLARSSLHFSMALTPQATTLRAPLENAGLARIASRLPGADARPPAREQQPPRWPQRRIDRDEGAGEPLDPSHEGGLDPDFRDL